MTATNHALTGAIIGLTIDKPYLAIPLALISHFICDAIPHYKSDNFEKLAKTYRFIEYLSLEACLCFLIVLGLFLARPDHWLAASLCAFLATSPDFFWIKKYLSLKNSKQYTANAFEIFASKIQWFQRPIGGFVELVWFLAAGYIYLSLLH